MCINSINSSLKKIYNLKKSKLFLFLEILEYKVPLVRSHLDILEQQSADFSL